MFCFGKILIYPTLVIVDVNLTSFCIFLLFQESTLRAEEEMGRGRTKLRYFMVESTRLLLFYAPGWFLFILLTRIFFFFFFSDKQDVRFKVLFVQPTRLKDKQGVCIHPS